MNKKTIALILWCVLVVGCFAAARSYLSAVLLTGTAAVVVFGAVSVKKSRTALSAALSMPARIRQGKKKSGKLTLSDSGAFPFFCVKGVVCCAWKPTGEGGSDVQPLLEDAAVQISAETDDYTEQTFSCTVPSYRKEEITVKINSARAGMVHVWLKELTVCDLLGVFQTGVDTSGVSADVVITRAPKQPQEPDGTPEKPQEPKKAAKQEQATEEESKKEMSAADAESEREKEHE